MVRCWRWKQNWYRVICSRGVVVKRASRAKVVCVRRSLEHRNKIDVPTLLSAVIAEPARL